MIEDLWYKNTGNKGMVFPGVQHFEYLNEWRRFLQWRRGDAIMLGEANVLPDEMQKYFGADGENIHMMFNFFVNQHGRCLQGANRVPDSVNRKFCVAA